MIEIRSHVLEIGEKRVRMRHDMHNVETGAVAAVCEITAVHLDKQAHKACPFSPNVRRAAEALLAGG